MSSPCGEPRDGQPDPGAWRALRELLDRHPARYMLWEAEPLAQTREALLELGVESVVYAPFGNAPPAGDLMSVSRDNAARLEGIGQAAAYLTSSSRER
jgi:zinc transport system substrate-binding protein